MSPIENAETCCVTMFSCVLFIILCPLATCYFAPFIQGVFVIPWIVPKLQQDAPAMDIPYEQDCTQGAAHWSLVSDSFHFMFHMFITGKLFGMLRSRTTAASTSATRRFAFSYWRSFNIIEVSLYDVKSWLVLTLSAVFKPPQPCRTEVSQHWMPGVSCYSCESGASHPLRHESSSSPSPSDSLCAG